jgi:hypothetical protein
MTNQRNSLFTTESNQGWPRRRVVHQFALPVEHELAVT